MDNILCKMKIYTTITTDCSQIQRNIGKIRRIVDIQLYLTGPSIIIKIH